MVFVTTADGRKGIDAIPYTALKNDMRKSVRTLRATLENVDVLNGGAEPDSKTTEDDAPTTPAADQPEFTEWKNTAGRAIEAAAREVKGGKVLFLLPNERLSLGVEILHRHLDHAFGPLQRRGDRVPLLLHL